MMRSNEMQEEFWFRLYRKEDLREPWKAQIEILFMLKGKGRIYFANMKSAYTVREEDILKHPKLQILAKSPEDIRSFTLEELLPQSFGPENLD